MTLATISFSGRSAVLPTQVLGHLSNVTHGPIFVMLGQWETVKFLGNF